MTAVADLWLPILVAAVAVFVVSSLIHMALQYHKHDYVKLPGEDKILEAMRGVQPGSYRFPCADTMKEMCGPEMTAKMVRGPVGSMTVIPSGPMRMGKALGQWFVLCVVICFFTGYISGLSLAHGAQFMAVFRVATTVALLGFGFSSVTDSIWKGLSWGVTAKFVLDGILYALATGAVFAWLWPKLM
ncbi:MAG: hypothetical protein K8S98_15615 [Planctomycetes bacterium]|nr:hypothetical protein [Planctomycetota bacterium]